MLASDVANPEFGGSQNPDNLLHVEFYIHAALDANKSAEAGKEVRCPPIPYIRIMRPGDGTSIIETPVRDEHKARWPQRWLAFQMAQGMLGDGTEIPGWKLADWSGLNADQRHELAYLRFSTVEQLAGASDAQVQRLGIGGIGLREQARQALKAKQREEVKAEIEVRDKEIAELRERDIARERELAEIRAMVAGTAKRRGRPPKKELVSA